MNIKVNIDGIDYEGNVEPVTKDSTPEVTPQEQTGFERVAMKDFYFKLLTQTSIIREVDGNLDREYYKKANYINDNEMANNYTRAFQLFLQLSRWQAEHDSVPDLKSAFYIRYDYNEEEFYALCNDEVKGVFEIPFSTSENAQLALDEFRPELEWLFTEFKPNLKWR